MSTTTPDVLPYLGDAYVELDSLTDAATGLFINNATVVVTLKTKRGDSVTNATGLSASYVPASNGKYRAVIPRTAVVFVDQHYRCEAVATSGSYQMPFVQEVIVKRFAA